MSALNENGPVGVRAPAEPIKAHLAARTLKIADSQNLRKPNFCEGVFLTHGGPHSATITAGLPIHLKRLVARLVCSVSHARAIAELSGFGPKGGAV